MRTRLTEVGDRTVDMTCACGNSLASGTDGLPELLAMSMIPAPINRGAGSVRYATRSQGRMQAKPTMHPSLSSKEHLLAASSWCFLTAELT